MAVIRYQQTAIGSLLLKRTCILAGRPRSSAVRTFFSDVSDHDLNTPVIRCKNKSFLPGSMSENYPDYLSNTPKHCFKAIRAPNGVGLHEAGKELRKFLDENWNEFQAILVKSMPVNTSEDFSVFGKTLGYPPMTYRYGSAFRQTIIGDTYSASDEPKEFCIEPHNEMSYLKTFPSKVRIFSLNNVIYSYIDIMHSYMNILCFKFVNKP